MDTFVVILRSEGNLKECGVLAAYAAVTEDEAQHRFARQIITHAVRH